MKILFICKHNRFRSKVAEAIFNELNKNKEIKAYSVGQVLDDLRPYIEKNVIDIMKKKGYRIKGNPVKINLANISKFDMMVLVADNLCDMDKIISHFKGQVIKWKIEDCNASDIEKIRQIIDKIEFSVKRLIKKLDKFIKEGNVRLNMKCTSCNVEFSEGVQFKCPSCGKQTLARCSKCKRLAAPYECKCGFKGP